MISAVEGFALAGGTELALATDLIVAAEDAMFGIPEVKRGLFAAGGGLLRLPGRIPFAIAMELALTGDNLPAVRAAELGLVNRLSKPGSALDDALAPARTITANGPLAVAATKQIMVESRNWPAHTMFAEQQNSNLRCSSLTTPWKVHSLSPKSAYRIGPERKLPIFAK